MDVSYIKLMAKYEAIQFRRGWIFKLFVLIVVGINVSQLFIQGNFVRNEWYWMALPSSFPYFQALCFNMVQVLFNPEIAKVCNRRLVAYTPGCGSVSEVGFAQEVGCDLCKIFPGDVLGAKLVKGLLAPMPWSKLMVTGGVEPTQENLTSWIKAGVFCVGMGSKLFPGDKVAAEDWAYVTAKCKEALGYIAEARANK